MAIGGSWEMEDRHTWSREKESFQGTSALEQGSFVLYFVSVFLRKTLNMNSKL